MSDPWPAGSSAALLTFAPIIQHESLEFAPLGLKNMLNGGGAIVDLSFSPSGKGSSPTSVRMEVRGTGEFMAYCSQEPSAVYGGEKGMRALAFDHDPASCQLLIQLPSEGLLDETVVIEF